MSDGKNAFALRRRQLLQAGTAGVAAATVPGCLVGVGDGSPGGQSDGSASSDPIDAATPDAFSSSSSSSPDAAVQSLPEPPVEDSSPPPLTTPDAGNATAMDARPMDARPMDAEAIETGPTAACVKDGNTFVFPLAQHPELAKVGSAAVLYDPRYIDPVCQLSAFYIVQTSPGKYAAFSAECTHACCEANVQGTSLYCACHGSRFNLMTGQVTNGPARRNLPSLPVSTDGSNVCVQLK
jgi:nitrite reductase/ring-hydroxylating ferredoxin subunit